MGFIYMITCKKNQKKYIGQTTSTIKERWNSHKYCANALIRVKAENMNNNENPEVIRNIPKSALYCAMAAHGIENFTYEQIVEVKDEELNESEIYYIKEYNTLSPNGYNLTTGGDSHYQHSAETVQKMIDIFLANIENRRHEFLKGLPPYSTYCEKKKTIIVVKHPLCSYKSFSIDKHGSLENTRNAVITFIKNLESTGVPYKKEKAGGNDLLNYPGIRQTKKGYKVEKRINKVQYKASFELVKYKPDESKRLAIEYYETVIRPLLQQNPQN